MIDIIKDDDAIKGIKDGIDKVADTVGMTAGPKGKNVVIAQGFGASVSTNDGVTVARSISLKDPVEDIGAHMVKEVATNTEEATGDGTTTATILLQSIVEKGLKQISAGYDPNLLKIGMSRAANHIVENLEGLSVPVENHGTIEKVAVISSNNDEFLGGVIAEAFRISGEEGIITVNESGTFDTFVEEVEGLRFDRGIMHRVFVNNEQLKRADLENPRILVTDKRINSSLELQEILKKVNDSSNRRLLIISNDINQDVLYTIALAVSQKTIDLTCVKAPGFGDTQGDILEDIAAVVGAKFIGEEMDLSKVELDDLGSAEFVYAGRDETTIVGGKSKSDVVEARIANVKEELKQDLEDHPRKKLEERLGYLKGRIAVVCVGAASDTELTEKKYRIEDSIGAVKSAIEEGFVPGGGLALIKAASTLNTLETGDSQDEALGVQIVADAIRKPFDRIVENAGLTPDTVLNIVMKEEDPFYGVNLKTEEYGNLLELGVIDPVKVSKIALLNAVSVAGMMMTTGAVVFEGSNE